MKKSQKSTPVTLIAFVLTLFVVFVIAAFLLLGKADTNAEFRTRLMSFDGNWTVKVNGSTAEAGSLPIKIVNPPSGITTIERNLPTSINEFDAIAIRNYHHLLHVRVGDDLLYAYPNLGWNGVGNIISDEWIIQKDPQVIVKMVSGTKNILGKTINNYSAASAKYNELAARPGWSEISAVKNSKVIILNSSVGTTAFGCAVAPLMLAKVAYPEKFADIDVDAYTRNFYKKYWGSDLTGTWRYTHQNLN